MEKITLPYANNTQFTVTDLINYFKSERITYMIIGATHVTMENHPKPKSLDVWIRNHKNIHTHKDKDTCQAVNKVINQLITHKSFSLGLRKCPKSNRMCKALVFCDNEK
jgi:hypothetical protein